MFFCLIKLFISFSLRTRFNSIKNLVRLVKHLLFCLHYCKLPMKNYLPSCKQLSTLSGLTSRSYWLQTPIISTEFEWQEQVLHITASSNVNLIENASTRVYYTFTHLYKVVSLFTYLENIFSLFIYIFIVSFNELFILGVSSIKCV